MSGTVNILILVSTSVFLVAVLLIDVCIHIEVKLFSDFPTKRKFKH